MIRSLPGLLVRSPLGWTLRARHRKHLRVLAFHSVDDGAAFRRLMERLVDGYVPVDVDAVLRWLDGGGLPAGATLVTFDDAHPSVLHRGAPVLRELGVPAVVFVVAGLIGGDRPPWWEEVAALRPSGSEGLVRELKTLPDAERRIRLDRLREVAGGSSPRSPQLTADELRELEAAGVELGNHTFDHPILPRCGDREVEEQIVSAHEALTRIASRPPRTFAYPNGDTDPRAESILARLGYGAAFRFDHRITRRAPDRPFALSRLRLDAAASPERFEQMMSGVHPFLYQARRRLGLP